LAVTGMPDFQHAEGLQTASLQTELRQNSPVNSGVVLEGEPHPANSARMAVHAFYEGQVP
ncbi:MAG: hypothetical protein L0G72_11600, partial [Brevibacterium aurantiacum]|nr:hypothetical protein [Brevibacterium aurantiacum]